jgi:hypothetical protein
MADASIAAAAAKFGLRYASSFTVDVSKARPVDIRKRGVRSMPAIASAQIPAGVAQITVRHVADDAARLAEIRFRTQ